MSVEKTYTAIRDNFYTSRHVHKELLTCTSTLVPYDSTYEPPLPSNICRIGYAPGYHPLDVAERIIKTSQGNSVMIMHSVRREFDGKNIDTTDNLPDKYMIVRTNFCNLRVEHNPYPLADAQCVYDKNIVIIRPPSVMPEYGPDGYAYLSMATVAPVQPKLMADNSSEMSPRSFVHVSNTIESVFQAGISENHNVLVLTPYGLDDGCPISDVISIYNYCICKYGHMFSDIIFALPDNQDLITAYKENIIDPVNVVRETDTKYDSYLMQQKLRSRK